MRSSLVTCPCPPAKGSRGSTPLTDLDETIRYTGFYLRDQVRLTDRLNASVTLRRDWASVDSTNVLTGTSITDENYATTTGSAGLIYEVIDGVSPYVSYAESFLPIGGVDFYGQPFKPTRGKQWEAGVKWQPAGQGISAYAALYQLRETNRKTNDPANPMNSLQVGEAKVRTLAEQIDLETRTRTLNPKWFEGMLKHGYEGVRNIETPMMEAARMLGIKGWRMVTEVLVPGAMPMIFTGLRLSLQASWTTLVAAELIGALYGLGSILNVNIFAQGIRASLVTNHATFKGLANDAQ